MFVAHSFCCILFNTKKNAGLISYYNTKCRYIFGGSSLILSAIIYSSLTEG